MAKSSVVFLLILISLTFIGFILPYTLVVESNKKFCQESIVINRFVSDRILYKDESMSDNWDNDRPHYYLLSLTLDGKTWMLTEVTRDALLMSTPGTKLSCQTTVNTWREKTL